MSKIANLIFLVAGIAHAALAPNFAVNPKDTVAVGEEVLFSAMSTHYEENPALLRKARYEWNFGDGYSFKFGSPLSSTNCSGIGVVHYFMRPGAFTVKLTVSVYSTFDSDGNPQGTPVVGSFSKAVTVFGEAPLSGFSLLHASFTAHLAQYVYATIPAAYRGNQTSLHVRLAGPNNDTVTLVNKSILANEEKFLVDQRSLVSGDYTLIAELINSGTAHIPGGILLEKISKPFSGVPAAGIDENNAFCVNGQVFFPIAPYMTDVGSETQLNIDSAGINALHTEGYYPNHTVATWTNYLSQAASNNLMCIGPTRGSYSWGEDYPGPIAWRFNHDLDTLQQYVVGNRNKPAMLMWSWEDEPNLGGWSTKVYSPVMAAWQYVCHSNDPQHPVGNGLYLYDWMKLYGTTYCSLYDYMTSDTFFGGKKWMQDALGGDAYPLSYRLHPSLNYSDMGPIAAYLDGIDRLLTNSKNLAPFLPYIQPCKEQATDTVPAPTADQIFMLAWLNVIHGAKGILWFEYFDDATIQWGAMRKFAQQIKPLAPIVLGPQTARTVANDATSPLKRVDIMVREADSTTAYLFAARVTEPDTISAASYKGVEPKSIIANLSVSGFTGSYPAVVLYENRTIATKNGQFADTFARNAVHIYVISTSMGVIDGAKKKRPDLNVTLTYARTAQEQLIRFVLHNGTDVQVAMNDVRGKAVKVFLSNQDKTDNYTIHFLSGKLSEGIYFIRIKAGEYVTTKKIEIIP